MSDPGSEVGRSMPDQDQKRTGVKASKIGWTEPPCELINGRWYGPPGAFVLLEVAGEVTLPKLKCSDVEPDDTSIDHAAEAEKRKTIHYVLACPGCGQMGSPREGQKWIVTDGSIADVTTMTLSPSIAKSCCGWHGHLKNGVFVSC